MTLPVAEILGLLAAGYKAVKDEYKIYTDTKEKALIKEIEAVWSEAQVEEFKILSPFEGEEKIHLPSWEKLSKLPQNDPTSKDCMFYRGEIKNSLVKLQIYKEVLAKAKKYDTSKVPPPPLIVTIESIKCLLINSLNFDAGSNYSIQNAQLLFLVNFLSSYGGQLDQSAAQKCEEIVGSLGKALLFLKQMKDNKSAKEKLLGISAICQEISLLGLKCACALSQPNQKTLNRIGEAEAKKIKEGIFVVADSGLKIQEVKLHTSNPFSLKIKALATILVEQEEPNESDIKEASQPFLIPFEKSFLDNYLKAYGYTKYPPVLQIVKKHENNSYLENLPPDKIQERFSQFCSLINFSSLLFAIYDLCHKMASFSQYKGDVTFLTEEYTQDLLLALNNLFQQAEKTFELCGSLIKHFDLIFRSPTLVKQKLIGPKDVEVFRKFFIDIKAKLPSIKSNLLEFKNICNDPASVKDKADQAETQLCTFIKCILPSYIDKPLKQEKIRRIKEPASPQERTKTLEEKKAEFDEELKELKESAIQKDERTGRIIGGLVGAPLGVALSLCCTPKKEKIILGYLLQPVTMKIASVAAGGTLGAFAGSKVGGWLGYLHGCRVANTLEEHQMKKWKKENEHVSQAPNNLFSERPSKNDSQPSNSPKFNG